MKRVVRLTESELNNIIKKVISEQPLADPAKYAEQLKKNQPAPRPPEMAGTKTIGKSVSEIQGYLQSLGYDLGPKGVDGYNGPLTQKALQDFQASLMQAPTGQLTLKQYQQLQYKARTEGTEVKQPSVEEIQKALVAKGYPLKVDGINGPKTMAAVKDFQTKSNLKPTGYLDKVTAHNIVFKAPDKPLIAKPEQKTPVNPVQSITNIIKPNQV